MEAVSAVTGTVVRLVDLCRRRAGAVAALFLALTVAAGWYTAGHIRMDTDTDRLLSADLPWKQQERAYDAAFPQFQRRLVAVIDGVTPDRADDAAAALTARLEQRPDLFRSVRRGDAPYLRTHGLLFLKEAELRDLADRLIGAQPMIGSLAADPSPRGLFAAVNLLLEGARRGQLDLAATAPILDGIATAALSAARGEERPISWQALFTGREPGPLDLRRFVLIQPALDFGSLSPTESATDAVRAAVRDLGLTPENGVRVRLTGNIAMEEEEFRTVADGAEVSAAGSLLAVAVLLFLCLRSGRLILPILLTLIAGLAFTFAFAVGAVGTLNPISIAFAVLFIGMGVDFGIQVATRYRDRRHALADPADAMRATARGIAGPLLLAAGTTAAGFLAFLPTDYVGVSQLGLIAGVGMAIAAACNLTLLPALLTLFRPRPEPEPVGYAALAPLDRLLAVRRRAVLTVALGLGVAGLLVLPLLRFDFNPVNLRDAETEAVSTALELMADRDTTPFTVQILAESPAAAAALAGRLEALPEVHRALSIASFVPAGQDRKLPILDDVNLLLGPTLMPVAVAPPPTPAQVRAAMAETVERLRALPGGDARAERLAAALSAVLAAGDDTLAQFGRAVAAGLPGRLAALRGLLSAGPVTPDTIPPDFRRDWVTADGRARVEVSPAGDGRDPDTLVRFVEAVRTVAPAATGTAVTIQESARVIVGAFRDAGLVALGAIVAVLLLVLRRPLDVTLVLAPLALATILTGAVAVAVGLALNFANIIALPLLMGAGVAFAIYYVVNARAGQDRPLQSSTTRAVFYSALTTAVAFGSLALSKHPGTASMGLLLLIGLGVILLTVFLVLPALLAAARQR